MKEVQSAFYIRLPGVPVGWVFSLEPVWSGWFPVLALMFHLGASLPSPPMR